jgi:hypothetical protein
MKPFLLTTIIKMLGELQARNVYEARASFNKQKEIVDRERNKIAVYKAQASKVCADVDTMFAQEDAKLRIEQNKLDRLQASLAHCDKYSAVGELMRQASNVVRNRDAINDEFDKIRDKMISHINQAFNNPKTRRDVWFNELDDFVKHADRIFTKMNPLSPENSANYISITNGISRYFEQIFGIMEVVDQIPYALPKYSISEHELLKSRMKQTCYTVNTDNMVDVKKRIILACDQSNDLDALDEANKRLSEISTYILGKCVESEQTALCPSIYIGEIAMPYQALGTSFSKDTTSNASCSVADVSICHKQEDTHNEDEDYDMRNDIFRKDRNDDDIVVATDAVLEIIPATNASIDERSNAVPNVGSSDTLSKENAELQSIAQTERNIEMLVKLEHEKELEIIAKVKVMLPTFNPDASPDMIAKLQAALGILDSVIGVMDTLASINAALDAIASTNKVLETFTELKAALNELAPTDCTELDTLSEYETVLDNLAATYATLVIPPANNVVSDTTANNIFSSDATAVDILNSGSTADNIFTPDTLVSDTTTDSIFTPDTIVSFIAVSDTKATNISTPDTLVSDTTTAIISNLDTSISDIPASDTRAADGSNASWFRSIL